ncbi:glycosyltransferase family 31 protein [Hypoxylon sp. EC38]|nr:glycosyltransferase family 31 protein [Hypoxylon sp. EC38]
MFRSIAPYGRVRTFQILASFLVFCILLSTLRLYRQQTPPPSIYDYTDGKTRGARQNETGITKPISDETSYLRYLVQEYGLTNEIPYFARRIRPQFNSGTRKSMTEILGSKFMARDFQRIRADDEQLDLHAEKPIHISITKSPMPDKIDASALLFGISTSYDRLTYGNSSLIHDWARWLTNGKGTSNGASLVLTLHRATSSKINHISSKLNEVGIDAVVLLADSTQDSTARYLDLVHLLARHKDELQASGREKKFLALVDDDVFFPSLGKLLSRLNKYYDARKRLLYLGMPSERADWTVENNVTLTYGGGAVFLTAPMIDSVSRLPCVNTSARDSSPSPSPSPSRTRTGQWDEALYTCITTSQPSSSSRSSSRSSADSKLHILPSLYIPPDDLSGLRTGYESGVQPLTLHHYKHRHRFEAGNAHLVASACGESCFLQRFFFRDDGWVVVNGYSVAQYPDGVDVVSVTSSSLRKSERNRGDGKGGGGGGGGDDDKVRVDEHLVFDKEDAPERRLDDRKVVSWAGTKRTWRLLDSRMGSDGAVWQAYVKRKGSPITYGDEEDRLPEDDMVHTQDGPSDVDSIIVLVWEP